MFNKRPSSFFHSKPTVTAVPVAVALAPTYVSCPRHDRPWGDRQREGEEEGDCGRGKVVTPRPLARAAGASRRRGHGRGTPLEGAEIKAKWVLNHVFRISRIEPSSTTQVLATWSIGFPRAEKRA